MKNAAVKVEYFSKIEELFVTTLAAQSVKFMFSNVNYRPTVHKTGGAF